MTRSMHSFPNTGPKPKTSLLTSVLAKLEIIK